MWSYKFFLIIAILFLFCLGCSSSEGGADPLEGLDSEPYSAGDKKIYTAGGVSFCFNYVPGGLSFPTETSSQITAATVTNAYWIAETEVSYELWNIIYTWATTGTGGAIGEGLYVFSEQGRQGADDSAYINPVGTNQHPVTSVNWRTVIVWCNALTEWYISQTGESYNCVYYTDPDYSTPLRTSTGNAPATFGVAGSQDKPYIYAESTGNTDMEYCTAEGFRLLTGNEWRLAARYLGKNAPNTGGSLDTERINGSEYPDLTNGYYWSPDQYASGSIENIFDADAIHAVAVCNTSSTAAVKSLGPASANTLGIYDMSGNILEWCFDFYGYTDRLLLGGCWEYSVFSVAG